MANRLTSRRMIFRGKLGLTTEAVRALLLGPVTVRSKSISLGHQNTRDAHVGFRGLERHAMIWKPLRSGMTTSSKSGRDARNRSSCSILWEGSLMPIAAGIHPARERTESSDTMAIESSTTVIFSQFLRPNSECSVKRKQVRPRHSPPCVSTFHDGVSMAETESFRAMPVRIRYSAPPTMRIAHRLNMRFFYRSYSIFTLQRERR